MTKAIRWTPEQLAAFNTKKAAGPLRSPNRQRALGRLKRGEMNKWEKAYESHLEQRKSFGEVAWFKFEGIKLRLADMTTLTVDFFVLLSNGELEAHDVKGCKRVVDSSGQTQYKPLMEDDAWAKIKIAADMYPFRFYVCFQKPIKEGGGWIVEEV